MMAELDNHNAKTWHERITYHSHENEADECRFMKY